jgi:hypothetical protein
MNLIAPAIALIAVLVLISLLFVWLHRDARVAAPPPMETHDESLPRRIRHSQREAAAYVERQPVSPPRGHYK